MQQQETSRLVPVGNDDTIGPESCVFATTAHSQFMALAASSHPRCGALSPARPLCAVPSLVGGSLWRDFVLATATRFALVVAVGTDHYLLVVGVSPLLLSVTHDARWGPLRPSRQMVSHRTGISRCFAPCSFLMFGDWQESPYQRVPHTIPKGGICMYFNGNWIVLHNKQSEGESTLSIWKIGGESLLTTTSSEGFPSVEMEPFVMPISWGGKPYSDAFCFNKMDPDEAVVITGDTRTDRTSFTLIDMRNTHESKSLVTVLKMETEGRFGTFGIKSLVMRRMCGSVVFVVQLIQGVFQVESQTGSATRICSGCTYLGQISSSVFCMWFFNSRSYSLWDCNNTEAPLRIFEDSSTFFKVTVGRGFFITVHQEREKEYGTKKTWTLTVIEALSGTETFHVSFPPSISQCNLEINESCSFTE